MTQHSISQTIFRNSSLGFGAQATIKVLSFIFSIMVVRKLGAEIFGQYMAVLAFTAIFSIFSDLGMSAFSVRQVARLREQPDFKSRVNELYGNVLGLRILLSILTIGLVILFAWITRRSPERIFSISLYAMTLILYSAGGASDSILQGFERIDISSLGKVINQFTFVFFGTLALIFKLGVNGLIGATLISVGLMAVFCFWQVHKMGIRPKPGHRFDVRQLIRLSLPFGIIGFALGLSYKFSTVFLDIYRSSVETGFYNAAYNLIFSFVLISNILNTTFYPTLARQSVNSPGDLPLIYQRVFRYLLIISLPIAVGGWAMAGPIIHFLYDVEFSASTQVFQIVIWTVPLMFMSEFLGYVIVLSNREKRVAIAVTISSLFNVLMIAILVPRFGLIAAACVAVLTEAILVTQHLITLRTVIPTIPRKAEILQVFLPPLGMGIITVVLRNIWPFWGVLAACVLSYGMLVVLTRALGKSEIVNLWKLATSRRKPAARNEIL
jgi:O-antigen/teichoic acid export membrane protein